MWYSQDWTTAMAAKLGLTTQTEFTPWLVGDVVAGKYSLGSAARQCPLLAFHAAAAAKPPHFILSRLLPQVCDRAGPDMSGP